MSTQQKAVAMLDEHDASHDRLRLAVRRAVSAYDEPELFACLADPEPILRSAAARELHIRGTRSSFDHAVELVGHVRFDLREIGAFLLGQLGTPICPYATETFQLLTTLLDDDYVEVRSAAAEAIGSLGSLVGKVPDGLLPKLIELAANENAGVRAGAAFALGMSDKQAALACLSGMEDDPDPDVREMVELGLELSEARDMHDRPAPRNAAE